jgi:hypothetical protein
MPGGWSLISADAPLANNALVPTTYCGVDIGQTAGRDGAKSSAVAAFAYRGGLPIVTERIWTFADPTRAQTVFTELHIALRSCKETSRNGARFSISTLPFVESDGATYGSVKLTRSGTAPKLTIDATVMSMGSAVGLYGYATQGSAPDGMGPAVVLAAITKFREFASTA